MTLPPKPVLSKLLVRQLRRTVGADFLTRLQDGTAPTPFDAAALAQFIERVDTAYQLYERDLHLRTRSLEISSQELNEAIAIAENANALKSRFLANVSHEIRTPLHGIIGLLELLQSSALDDKQARYVSVVAQSANSLLAIMNELLDLAKIEAGQMRIDREPFEVRTWLDTALQSWQGRAEAKGLHLSGTVSSAVPPEVVCDPLRLSQVVTNLVGNALKFTEHGEVAVVLDWHAPDQLKLTVSDTGIGIEPAQLTEIFKRFAQADASTTRRYGGTGLGLSICVELTQLMGGTICAHSQPNHGSTFVVQVPAI
jgi:signal transduction histidine kinase